MEEIPQCGQTLFLSLFYRINVLASPLIESLYVQWTLETSFKHVFTMLLWNRLIKRTHGSN